MYDVLILCLMLAGISAVVVYSYKIFRSRVYPVGMVRRVRATQECEDATASILPDFETAPEHDEFIRSVVVEGFSDEEVFVRRRLGPPSGRRQYILTLRHYLRQTPFHEREDSGLEGEVVEHGEALKRHSKQFEDFEKRLRRLELESVQKVQEGTEEKPQPPLIVQ